MSKSSKFYSCSTVVNKMDRNGEPPELFIVASRTRGAGKTFSFTKMLVDQFFDSGETDKFVLLCRWTKHVGNVAEGMMKGMLQIEYEGWWVEEKKRMNGSYSVIYLCRKDYTEDEEGTTERHHCGYVVPLNGANTIKMTSSVFTDSVHALFDEFQPEDSKYVSDEPEKFKSIHTSIARGGGESRRFYPVYMCGNAVSMENPYFEAMQLHRKIQRDTKLYKGDGFIYQRWESEEIASEHDRSAMSRAMPGLYGSNYGDGGWFLDDSTAIAKPTADWGPSMYVCTLVSGGKNYGVHMFIQAGLLYVSHGVDHTKSRILRTTIDGDANLAVLKYDPIAPEMKYRMRNGLIRFQDLSCKNVAMEFMW